MTDCVAVNNKMEIPREVSKYAPESTKNISSNLCCNIGIIRMTQSEPSSPLDEERERFKNPFNESKKVIQRKKTMGNIGEETLNSSDAVKPGL